MPGWDDDQDDPKSFAELLSDASDFDLCNGLLVMLDEHEDELSAEHPGQVVLRAMVTGGKIENGGFEFLFSWDYPADPDFSRSLKAYETIGCEHKADACRDALAVFPNSQPPTDADERIALYDEHSEALRDEYSNRFFGCELQPDREAGDKLYYRQLAAFIRAHAEEFRFLDDLPDEKPTPAIQPPGGEVTILSVLILCGGVYMAVDALRDGRSLLGCFYMVPAIGSVLIWLKQEWGKWLIAGYFGMACGGGFLLLIADRFTVRGLLRVGFAAYLAWVFSRWTTEEKRLQALVAAVRERLDSWQTIRIVIPLEGKINDEDRRQLDALGDDVQVALAEVSGGLLAKETASESVALLVTVVDVEHVHQNVLPVLKEYYLNCKHLKLIGENALYWSKEFELEFG